MSQLAKRARHPSQLLELPVTKTTLLNTPFQLTTPIDTRHGIPQADAVANSTVVEEKIIGAPPERRMSSEQEHHPQRQAEGLATRIDVRIRKPGRSLDPTGGAGAY